jgi:polysaccharide biosynthesis transport protein
LEEQIDLRSYFDVLHGHWKWIAGVTMLTALVTAVVSFLLPPTFEATATAAVLFSQPAAAQANTRSLLSPETQLTLLQSTDVALRTIDSLGDRLPADAKQALLRGERMRVLPDPTDKSLFRIIAQSSSAPEAADVANAWAEAGIQLINQNENQALNQTIPMLQQAFDAAGKRLQAAEESLRAMQRDLQIESLSQQLARVQQTLDSQFAERENAKAALDLAQALQLQVQQGRISLTSDMLFNLQTAAIASGTSFSIQPSQFASLSRRQQLDQLDAVLAALNGRLQALSTSIENNAAQVTMLQRQLNEKQSALIEPTRLRDDALADYKLATSQLRDAQARLAEQQNPARVLTRAVAPNVPVAPKKTQNIAFAGAVGLVINIFGAFVFEYFSKPRREKN